MTHSELVKKARLWLESKSRCRFAFEELPGLGKPFTTGESPDVIGFGQGFSIVLEIKTSKQDFKKDAEKPFREKPETGVGNYRLFVCAEGLIPKEELPKGWGLIEVTKRGALKLIHGELGSCQNSRKRKTPFWFESNLEAERGLLFTAMSRVYYSGLLGVINAWNSNTYSFMVNQGNAELNSAGLAYQLGTVPEKTAKPRTQRRRKKK